MTQIIKARSTYFTWKKLPGETLGKMAWSFENNL